MRYFPTQTNELFTSLTDSSQDKLRVEICVENEEYIELAEHDEIVTIAIMVVGQLAARLLVELLAAYLVERFAGRKTRVRSRIIVNNEKSGVSSDISYEGPAEEYRKIMNGAIEKIMMNQSPDSATLKKRKPGQW